MITNQDYTLNFRNLGVITVPKGTKVSHYTATGFDANIHFVCEYQWIDRDYPKINKLLRHDMGFYGLDVPKEFVTEL
jgi:hypothetical protein